MEEEILHVLKDIKNISKWQAAFERIYSIMKKAYKNLTENELENVIYNLVDKTIKEFNQRSKSYAVPDFTDDYLLTEQTQEGTEEDATKTPSQDNDLLKRRSVRMKFINLLTKI